MSADLQTSATASSAATGSGDAKQAEKAAEKQVVKGYFETTGFERWNRIYSDSDDVNKVQRNIRIGHQKTVDAVLAWLQQQDWSQPQGTQLWAAGGQAMAVAIRQWVRGHAPAASVRRLVSSYWR